MAIPPLLLPPLGGAVSALGQSVRSSTHSSKLTPRDIDRIPQQINALMFMLDAIVSQVTRAADTAGFAEDGSLDTFLKTAVADAILCAQPSSPRFPPMTEDAIARRSRQAARDLRSLEATLDRFSKYPRVKLMQRLLGWGEGKQWNTRQRCMCLRWLAWVSGSMSLSHNVAKQPQMQQSPRHAVGSMHERPPPVRSMSKVYVDGLLQYTVHHRLCGREGYTILRKAARDPLIQHKSISGEIKVQFDMMLIHWTELWGSWENPADRAWQRGHHKVKMRLGQLSETVARRSHTESASLALVAQQAHRDAVVRDSAKQRQIAKRTDAIVNALSNALGPQAKPELHTSITASAAPTMVISIDLPVQIRQAIVATHAS
jgi:hypothetical protein